MSDARPDLEDLLEHMTEGLQLVDFDFRYRYLNAVAAAHGRRPREELLGRTMEECYPGIERTELFERIRRVAESGRAEAFENEFSFPDGRRGWFELRIARVPRGIMILSIDVTARRMLEAQVRRMERMESVGQLAGGIAHDFNNLLTVIQSCITFIREDLPEDHPLRRDADQVLEATTRGADLTQRLLAFAKQLPLPTQGEVDVVRSLRSLVVMLRRTLGGQVDLALHVPDALGTVAMNPGAFDQIVVNLVVNGRDALRGRGRIDVEAEELLVDDAWIAGHAQPIPRGRYVVVSVTDDGVGIPPAILDHVFEPFFTTKGETRGTGLGLATCWSLVDRAGGTITAYSEIDVGTTFRVYLPVVDSSATAEEEPPPSTSRAAETGILVVENDAILREVIARTLRVAGHQVLEVESADEAVSILRTFDGPIGLVVTDVVLPGRSGIELASSLREVQPGLRFLMMSGFGPRSLEAHGLDSQRMELLTKPFTPGALLARVDRVLTRDEG